jgi:hypothetical protein
VFASNPARAQHRRELLGRRVAGLVLTHTTLTNPVRTTSGAAFFSPIEKPVRVPLMYLTIGAVAACMANELA